MGLLRKAELAILFVMDCDAIEVVDAVSSPGEHSADVLFITDIKSCVSGTERKFISCFKIIRRL